MDDHIAKDNNNPINWDGNNRKCKLCDKDAENFDEYCEDHQRCIVCGNNKDCDCKEEMSQRSDCCNAKIDTDLMLCYDCKDHCEDAWTAEEQFVMMADYLQTNGTIRGFVYNKESGDRTKK